MSSDWSIGHCYFLSLMTLGYIAGECAHYLINTSSRELARDVHYGDQECFGGDANNANCSSRLSQEVCQKGQGCSWEYNGRGLDYQVLAGPSFILMFSTWSVAVGMVSDYLRAIGRHRLMALGVLLFSTSCCLMGMSNAFWQLVLLRMGIAAGEAVCRPIASNVIADLFSPTARGLANGIFSWGVYHGYGLAFVFGIYVTEADLLSYGWRASYVLASLPGFAIGFLLLFTVSDPKPEYNCSSEVKTELTFPQYLRTLAKSFISAPMLLMLLAAAVRQTGGYTWAYNTRPYFQTYYPDFDLGLWVFACSIGGGSFGVFFGGYATDKIVDKIGLHSTLWVLSACTLVATPFGVGTLYLPPPLAFASLLIYYFCAETWFAILFRVIVEVSHPEVRSTCIGLFLFTMNNIGGNLPAIVAPLSKVMGYREALGLVWPGSIGLSGGLFFLASLPMWSRERRNGALRQ